MLEGARGRGISAAVLLAVGGCLVLALCLLSTPRGIQLAYDGPYDTPPMTWYFPAQESQVRALSSSRESVNLPLNVTRYAYTK